MVNNKNHNSVVTELFISGRELNISLLFITQFYFTVPKTADKFMKIPNKQELQQIAFTHSSDAKSLSIFIKNVHQNQILCK